MKKITHDEFCEKVRDKYGDKFTILSRYTLCTDKIEYQCNICNTKYFRVANHLLTRGGCITCSNEKLKIERTKPHDEFIKQVNEINPTIEIIGKYINQKTKVEVVCKICGRVYSATPNNILNGRGCPACAKSKGEHCVKICLQGNKLNFRQEFEFDNLLSDKDNPLRFDFAVFDNNNELTSLIEYDGEFHYKQIYEEDNFKTLQIHDKRKNKYCKDNNIPLLRIPYWEFDNIEKILDEWLVKDVSI